MAVSRIKPDCLQDFIPYHVPNKDIHRSSAIDFLQIGIENTYVYDQATYKYWTLQHIFRFQSLHSSR